MSTGRAHFQQQCRAGDANTRKGRARAGSKRWLRALQGQGALGRHLQCYCPSKRQRDLNGACTLALVPTEVLLIEQRPQTKKRMSVMTCDGLRSAAGAATTEAGEKAVAERQGPPADLPRGEYLPTGQNVMTHGHCGVASSCRWARRAAAWLRLKRSTMAGMPPVAAQATAGFSAWASWELAGNAHSQCGTGAATQV